MTGSSPDALVGSFVGRRWTKRRRMPKPLALALLVIGAHASANAEITVTPAQPGLAEWRDAGPGTNTQGAGTRFATSTPGSGTVMENLHVLRVQVKASFTGLPESCEVWAGALGCGVDAQSHGSVRGLTFDNDTYTCVPLANSNGTVSPLYFHVSNPSAEQSETVRYFIYDTSTETWYSATTEYVIKRFDCHDAGIDTRLTFGDPNAAGRIEANPNEPGRNVVFANWVYRGGLFAGHMPWQNGSDRSGTARIQFFYDPGETAIHASTLTLFRKGHMNSGTSIEGEDHDRGTPAMGVFKPLADDENLFTSGAALEAGSKWSTRLAITPQGEGTGTFRWDHHPISVPNVYLKNEYVNFPLDKYAENGTKILSTQSHAAKHLIVALASEADLSPEGAHQWRYFTSREYDALFTSGVYSNTQPRVWTLTEGEPSDFLELTVTE